MADVGLLETFEPLNPATPGAARRSVSDFARRHVSDEGTLAAIALCVTETVTNVVMHAYPNDNRGSAVVRGWRERDALCVAVTDDGVGLTPRVDSPGLGLGLPLIAQMTTEPTSGRAATAARKCG